MKTDSSSGICFQESQRTLVLHCEAHMFFTASVLEYGWSIRMCQWGSNTKVYSVRYFFFMLNELVWLLLFQFSKGFKFKLNYKTGFKVHFMSLTYSVFKSICRKTEKMAALDFKHILTSYQLRWNLRVSSYAVRVSDAPFQTKTYWKEWIAETWVLATSESSDVSNVCTEMLDLCGNLTQLF